MYSMDSRLKIAKQASQDLENFLKQQEETVDVINVEDDSSFRKKDVDLVWNIHDNQKKIDEVWVEIKGDTHHKTGNFFFETISNKSKNTPGCFLYTEAKLLFYYFVQIKKLYILPMPQTREWFKKYKNTFQERETKTPAGSSYYTTVGRLVPIHKVLSSVEGIEVFDLNSNPAQQIPKS